VTDTCEYDRNLREDRHSAKQKEHPVPIALRRMFDAL
jgi:hypothetical protein